MLDKIIESSKYVVNNSKYVHIDKGCLKGFARSIHGIKQNHWLQCSPFGLLDLPVEMIINFLLIYESIDFSFWGDPKWTINTNIGKEDGSMALLYTLLEFVKKNKTTDFSNIPKKEFEDILDGNIKIPLFEERYEIIRNVSNVVNEKMNGDFYNFVKEINIDSELFNLIVTYFPSFKDERTYKGKTIYLYKLAQLLTSDILHIRNMKENVKVDCSHLVGCSDYKIPQALRGLGILKYNKELEDIVDNKIEIKENSEYEIEIRASMLVSINMIKEEINDDLCAIDINDYLWNKSRNMELKPYHRVRTTNY